MSDAVAVPVALAWGKGQLEAAGRASAAAEARTLLAHAAGVEPSHLALERTVPAAAAEQFTQLVQRRASGIPLQHLTGIAYFRTIEVAVGPGVFIPRPETEVMTGWAIDVLAGLDRAPVVVELCTGSGAIAKAIATEVPGAQVHTCELDPVAVQWAQRNLAGTGAHLVEQDMADAFGELAGSVDLVISNPPYIPLEAWESVEAQVRDHDPLLALFSGQDGLDALRVVARRAAQLLRPGGVVCAEHAEVQHEAVAQLFVDQGGFTSVVDRPDLTGRPRFVTATRSAQPWQDGRRD